MFSNLPPLRRVGMSALFAFCCEPPSGPRNFAHSTVMPTGAPCGRTPFTLCHSVISSLKAAAGT